MDASFLHPTGNQFFNQHTPNSLDNHKPFDNPMSHPLTDLINLQALSAHVKTLGHDMTVFYYNTYDPMHNAHQNACCKKCGRKLSYRGEEDHNDAMEFSCIPDDERALESRAWLTSVSPRLLLQRLTEAVSELPTELQKFFDPGHFDASREILDSTDLIWRLQWYLRERPRDPISESNPQYPGGIVELERLVRQEDIFEARYIGPTINPNIGDDPDYWSIVELDTDTDGIAYRDDDELWRFRRITGTTGYGIHDPHHLRLLGNESRDFDGDSEIEDLYLFKSPMTSGDDFDPMNSSDEFGPMSQGGFNR